MSSIQKVSNKNGTVYRVFVRKKGLKTISKTFPNKRLASQFALQLENDKKAQLAFGGRSNTTTFEQLTKDYLLTEYQGSRPQQQQSRLQYWIGRLASKPIIDITKDDITLGLRGLPETLSNTTINKYKGVVSVVFSYALREYDLPDNPVRYIRSLPEERGRTRFLSNTERSTLFKACRSSQWPKLYLIVLMAITTGSRRGELLNLRWDDIDYDRQTAYVQTSKNGQPRILPLTNEVMIELNKFKDQEPQLIFNSEIKTNKPYEFYKLWKKALAQAQIEDFRFHDLRHTTASYLAQSGASLLEISDVLGHKQIQMTKRYAHLCIEHKSKLINRVMSDM